MNIARKRRILIWLAAFAGLGLLALAAASYAAFWALNYQAPCAQPCRDLGVYPLEPSTTDHSDPTNSFLNPANIQARENNKVEKPNPPPKCSPLKLDLELFKPETKANKRYTLWYRVTMKNISCLKLGNLDGLFFDGTMVPQRPYHTASGFKIKIWDSLGREVRDLGIPSSFSTAPENKTEYGDVIPYDNNPGVALKLAEDLGMTPNLSFDLAPGQSITTFPSRLFPTRMELVGMIDEYGRPGSGPQYRIIDLKDAPKPPPGFRILEQFVFGKPGKYRIQVIMEDANLPAKPLYPYAERVPWQLGRIMRFLGMVGGYDLEPVSRDTRQYHVLVESQTLEFEVKPRGL